MEHSKYYYDYSRNCGCTECHCGKESGPPSYYVGKNGYEAIKVIEGFQPNNYNIGTALTYLMRAGNKIYINNSKEESMIADINKAIDHLEYELQKMKK
tara:strand:- start:61 stop:354 length:294 start_codon:yes stop_codon:yes gene_type:complete